MSKKTNKSIMPELHAFDLKWFLETDDQGRTPMMMSDRKFCRSFACKQDTNTFVKPKTACLIFTNYFDTVEI